MVTLANRVKVSTSTTGTGTITLGSAETGYQSFADGGVSSGDSVRYTIIDGDSWEIGTGTYTETNNFPPSNELSRTLTESSTGSLLNLSGSAVVFITVAAEDVFQDPNTANVSASSLADDFIISGSGSVGMTINSTNDQKGSIYFGDSGTSFGAIIQYTSSSDELRLYADGSDLTLSATEVELDDGVDLAFFHNTTPVTTKTIITATTPSGTSNRTITLPDASGTVLLADSSTGDVEITDGDFILESTASAQSSIKISPQNVFDVWAIELDPTNADTVSALQFKVDGTVCFALGDDSNAAGEHYATFGALSTQLSLPKGTDAERPTTPLTGAIRYNETSTEVEFYNGSSWGAVGGGGGGGNTFDSSIIFEGATADDFETTLTVTDPTADRTITFGDQTGTAMLWQSAWPDDAGLGGSFAIGVGALASAGSTSNNNIAIGDEALNALTTGYRTVAVGDQALKTTTASSLSTAIGDQALKVSTNEYNTAVGASAMVAATTAGFNTAVGVNALVNSTTGTQNTAIGYISGGGDGSYSTYVGVQAGNYNTTSKDNVVAIGFKAMEDAWGDYCTAVGSYAASDGQHYGSVAIGYDALGNYNTSSPWYNVAVGYGAASGNYSGDYNVYMGASAAPYYNNSSYGVAIGYAAKNNHNQCTSLGAYAGYSQYNQSDYVTLIGAYAGYDLDGGDHCTFIGRSAGYGGGTGSYNVAIGNSAGYNFTSGGTNTFLGYEAGNGTTSGASNTFIGYRAGKDSGSNCDENICIGIYADAAGGAEDRTIVIGSYAEAGFGDVNIGYKSGGNATTSSSYNVGIGYEANRLGGGHTENVCIGKFAGYSVNGNNNVAVGSSSLQSTSQSGDYCVAVGSSALYQSTSSDANVAVGTSAGYSITTGGSNTLIGHQAGYSQDLSTTNALTTGSNVTCIGYNAVPSSGTATNEVTLGDNDITSLRCNVQTISSLSDERDKTAIEDLPYGLDFINDMRPVQFTWNRRDGSLGATPDMGFIAQDLYGVELDHSSTSRTRLVNWENPEKLEADYVRSYPILVKAVQELSAKVDALTARIAELEGE